MMADLTEADFKALSREIAALNSLSLEEAADILSEVGDTYDVDVGVVVLPDGRRVKLPEDF